MFLINEPYLKSTVNVSVHKDAADIKIALHTVAQIYIKDLLSIPLFELFQNHVETETTLTSKQAELFEMVKFYYALMVQHELMGNLFSISNKGNQEADNNANFELVKHRRTEVLSKADHIKNQVLQYLKVNAADFPQYYSNTTNTENANDFIVFYDTKK
jgi:hypothetical protein